MAKVKLSIGVLGPGAIGGLLAGLFCKEGHTVYCIGREPTVLLIKNQGLKIESQVFGDFTVKPLADKKLSTPVDILFVTLKAPFLKEALDAIEPSQIENAIIIPLLNGVGHREIIREKLGAHVAVGMIGMIEVVKNSDNVIQHLSTNKPHVYVASDSDISVRDLKKLVDIMIEIGISMSILNNEAEVIWLKLVRLSAIASTTAAFQMTLGAIRSNPEKRKVLQAMIREGAMVAMHDGVDINPQKVFKQVESLPETLMTSLQRDVHKHRASEIESITGGVLKLARSYNIPAPAHENAYEMIKNISSVG